MQHKFACLIELRSVWDSLSTDSFGHVVKHLLEIDVLGSYKKAIISGIFQQLYDEGDSNDDLFFAHLLEVSQNAQKLHSQSRKANDDSRLNIGKNKFLQLPDGLLCHIATYLPARCIFTKWNHVNRKFLQIGSQPQSIKHLKCMNIDFDYTSQHSPNFQFDLPLSRLESLAMNLVINDVVDTISTKHVRSLTLCMCIFCVLNLKLLNTFHIKGGP